MKFTVWLAFTMAAGAAVVGSAPEAAQTYALVGWIAGLAFGGATALVAFFEGVRRGR